MSKKKQSVCFSNGGCVPSGRLRNKSTISFWSDHNYIQTTRIQNDKIQPETMRKPCIVGDIVVADGGKFYTCTSGVSRLAIVPAPRRESSTEWYAFGVFMLAVAVLWALLLSKIKRW